MNIALGQVLKFNLENLQLCNLVVQIEGGHLIDYENLGLGTKF
jgi:hypothetical protein